MIVWEDAIIPQLFKPVHAHKSEKLHYTRVTNHRSVEAEPPWRAGGREKRKRREEGLRNWRSLEAFTPIGTEEAGASAA